MNADFGLISLLMLQLAAAAACVFAAYHLHGQVTRVKEQSYSKAEVLALVQKAEAAIAVTNANLTEAEKNFRERAETLDGRIRQIDIDAIDKVREKMRSLQGQLAAFKRYAAEADDDNPPPQDGEGLREGGAGKAPPAPGSIPFPNQPPQTNQYVRPPGFGQRVA